MMRTFWMQAVRFSTCLLCAIFMCACANDETTLATSSSKIQSPTSPVLLAKKHKSPSLGMGLTGINDWSTATPFIDLMKQSRDWRNWSGGDRNFKLDENGWPLELADSQEAGTVFLSANKSVFTGTRAIVFYEGEGEIAYSWSAQKIVDESKPGRDVIQLGSDNHLLVIKSTNPANPIRNIKIIPEQFIKEFEAGEIFNPIWLNKVSQFSSLRFMDWMATNNSTQENWKDRPLATDRSWAVKGVPLEIMLSLANQLLINPWFNIPHLADQNYIDAFALTVKETLDKRLTVYIEHSNEVWNWQFQQAQHAEKVGKETWPKVRHSRMQWHGIRTAEICDSFKRKEFGEFVTRVKCVLGVQTAWHGLEQIALSCPDWKGGSPCFKRGIDAIGVTGYFGGGLAGPRKSGEEAYEQEILNWISSGPKGLTQAFEQLNTGKQLSRFESLKDYKGVVQELIDNLEYWQSVAKKHGLELVAYEGGQHITGNGKKLQDNEDLINFHYAVNRDERMRLIYNDLFATWKSNGGGLFMHFVEISGYSKWGSWGALESFDQVTSPKWEAITEFNKSVKCWWPNCEIVVE